MSHPRHLEPFPSWKENKGESGDKTSPCVEGVEGRAPSGQTSWKGGCRVTSGAPGDLGGPGEGAGWCQSKTPSLSPLLCSFQPLLCESHSLPWPLLFLFPSLVLPHISLLHLHDHLLPRTTCSKTTCDSKFPPPYLDIPGLPSGLPTHLSTPSRLQLSPSLSFPTS